MFSVVFNSYRKLMKPIVLVLFESFFDALSWADADRVTKYFSDVRVAPYWSPKFLIGLVRVNPYPERKKIGAYIVHIVAELCEYLVCTDQEVLPEQKVEVDQSRPGSMLPAKKKKAATDGGSEGTFFVVVGFFWYCSWIIVFAQSSGGALKLLNMWTIV